MKPEHLHILQHSLGLDKYGRGEHYRNRYVTDSDSPAGMDCEELVTMGFMHSHGPITSAGGMTFYSVTAAGKDAVAANSPPSPKLSRSQARYLAYLKSASCFESFGHYLKDRAYE